MTFRPFIKAVTLACGMFAFADNQAQVTSIGNNPGPGSYVGLSGSNITPLEVRHNGNQRIQWYTDSLQRMQLWNTRYGTINGFTNVNQNGYLGISNQPLFFQDFFNSAGPFSRLHLADSCNNNQNDYAQVFGWRPWMKNGVSMTGRGLIRPRPKAHC